MKVDPVVSNSDELYITNQSQQNKIVYLQSCKTKQECYIRDLQQSLQFNKQSISMLTLAMAGQNQQLNKPNDIEKMGDKKEEMGKILNRLNEQNAVLIEKMKKYYDELMNVKYIVLIQQQLRYEEKRAYAERTLDFQNNMNQLRKYLQDKEQSFSTVVTRLKKYQDINQSPLQTKLHKLSNELGEEYAGELFKKMAEQRDKYKDIWEKININIQQLTFLRGCLDSQQSYEAMLAAYTKYREVSKQDKCISFCEPTKHTTGNTTNNSASNSFPKSGSQKVQSPNRELIKLLKKQKLNNDILQQAFNQAIEKNEELIIQNNTLVEANIQLQLRFQKLEAKCCLMENELGKIEGWRRQSRGKGNRKSEGGDRKREWERQFGVRGDEYSLCQIAMTEDMQKLSSFVLTCIPKGQIIKSSSNPNIRRRNEDVIEEGDDIQIQEL